MAYDWGSQNSYLGADMNSSPYLSNTLTGAATGAAAGGPWGAAIGAAGGFLSSYLQAQAQEEMNRKRMLAESAQTEQQGIQQNLNMLNNTYGRILGGR